ncbi:MAG: DUF167 domain-containing protein [Arenicellales bacterium]|nr:DUF167 domain-containing protein [Arenicellales bacterium]MDP6672073.1 DUF167 domain-containing protein [Arenicellales bacterium]MDP6724929.1 DUF167 domain-containing protein [Arenicellales bacterium]
MVTNSPSDPQSHPWYRWKGDCLYLALRVSPRASQTAFTEVRESVLGIRIKASPVDGKVNRALTRFLANSFGTPKHQITLIRGETGRTKLVSIDQPTTLPESLGIQRSSG